MVHRSPAVTLLAVASFAAELVVATNALAGSDVRLEVDAAGRVTAMAVDKTQLEVQPAPLVALYPVEVGRWIAPAVRGGSIGTGLKLDFPGTEVSAVVAVKPRGRALQFDCRVRSERICDRGLLLRFAFPLNAAGWHWHRDAQNAVAIQPSGVYENVVPLRAWADLPEWKEQPDLRMGYSNRNFATAITGPAVGLCLAVPLDRPCIFRTAYRGREERLELVYDFALSPDARTPNQAEFSFVLYGCDPRWGFRSALARYYELFPEMFARVVKQPGQWMAFSRLSEIDNADEFRFGLQEGASEPQYDQRLGVLSTTYFTHAGMGANIPDFNPEKDPLPPHDVQVQAMEKAFKQRTGLDGLYRQVGLYNAEGVLDVRKWVAYAHLIAQFNLDPELPYGRWTLDRALASLDEFRKARGADLGGFYYDGLSAGVNYRPDHFRTADSPCLWDPVAKKPAINNFYSSCEFARAAAEMLRPRGKITMMNGALGASFFVAPWLDVLGAETGLHLRGEPLNYIRSVTYHKPFLTLLKGNFHQQLLHPQIEQYMKECLAYGVVPGFFDWPTSGLGPGSGYWLHAAYYERDRDLFRKYLPLCCALAADGWEPATHARSATPSVLVERFGPAPDGPVWFTLFNDGKEPARTRLAIETKDLKLDPQAVEAEDAMTGKAVPLAVSGQQCEAELEIPPGDVVLLQVASPALLRRWHVAQAIDTLDRGVRMREIDRQKPPLAVHWPAHGRTYSRRSVSARWQMVLAADGKAAVGAAQWAMLFQGRPSGLTLRVRAAGEDLVGGKGAVGVECRLAWVTPSFAHYETRFFELPTGTYDARDFEFSIQCPEALRAVQVTPQLRQGVKGSLRLDRVSLVGPGGEEYVVDPEFAQWYEPVPEEVRGPVEQGVREVRAVLAKLIATPASDDAPRRQTVAEILDNCDRIRRKIAEANAESGCRRALRDLETVRTHVKAIAP
jgi:hypothetical protein